MDFVILFNFFAKRQLKPDEVTGIMKDFDEPGHLAPTGMHIEGVKYMVIQGEPNAVIRGKKVFFFKLNCKSSICNLGSLLSVCYLSQLFDLVFIFSRIFM